MLNWRELKDWEKPSPEARVNSLFGIFEYNEKEEKELETCWAICLDIGIEKYTLESIVLLNGYNKDTFSYLFYYQTGKYIDEISNDELQQYINSEHRSSFITTHAVFYKVSDIIVWIKGYLNDNKLSKAIDEVKKIESNFVADWKRDKDKAEHWDVLSKNYSKDLMFLCEWVNKISNIPDEFKKAVNEIISSFNDKSQYKVPLLK